MCLNILKIHSMHKFPEILKGNFLKIHMPEFIIIVPHFCFQNIKITKPKVPGSNPGWSMIFFHWLSFMLCAVEASTYHVTKCVS